MLANNWYNFVRLFKLGLNYYVSLYHKINYNILNIIIVLLYVSYVEGFIIIFFYYSYTDYSLRKWLQLCSTYIQYFIMLYISDYYNPDAHYLIKAYHCIMSIYYLYYYWFGYFYDSNNAFTYRAPFIMGYFSIVLPAFILSYLYPITQFIYTLLTIPILLDLIQHGSIFIQQKYYFSLNPLLLLEKIIKHYLC